MTKLFIIFLLWLPHAVFQIMTWVYWLQLKEYRYDRFWVFVKTTDGKNSLDLYKIVIKIAAIILSFKYIWILFATLIILDLLLVINIIKKNVRKPVFTQRVQKILYTCFVGMLFTFIGIYFFRIYSFAVGEVLLIATPIFGVLWTIPIVNKALDEEKKKAVKVLNKCKPTVIGITGSYGKTTTKDFIYQLLSTKYECLSTLKNQNTHFGILRRINFDLKRKHRFFIAEIGAYKKGEISEVARIIKPKVAVITGIEPQHIELFGSFENLKEAKFELVKNLQENGLALFNLTDKNTYPMFEKAKNDKKKVKIYSYGVSNKIGFDACSSILKTSPKGILFSLRIGKETKRINTNIISKDLIENLTVAIFIARLYKISWSKIINKCKNIELPESTLNIFKDKRGFTVIDDSYNASPSGFMAALEILNLLEGKRKYVLTTGIIELGNDSFKVHKKIGNYLDKYSDVVLLRYKEFEKALLAGMGNKDKLKVINNPKKIVNYLNTNIRKGDVILVEGKNPLVLKHLKDK